LIHEITLLRHGLSVANSEGILQGQLDSPLTVEGRQQAEALATFWQATGTCFDQIITSPLRRALETAEIIAPSFDLTVEVDDRWMERAMGAAEGASIEDARAWYSNRERPTSYEPIFDKGESDIDLFRRAAEALQSLLIRPPGSFLVISHGAFLSTVFRVVLGLAPSGGRFRNPRIIFSNTGFTSLDYNHADARWTIKKLNATPHLPHDKADS
jgi:2,3-bisphosphoglycerate-dependent phosphoglycerate mutase